MASQLEGYEFDIFISYWHNDNKYLSGVGEGWVTEFVAKLRRRTGGHRERQGDDLL